MSYAIMRINKIKSISSIVAAERHGKERGRLKHRLHPEREKENFFYKKHSNLSLLQSFKEETKNIKVRKNAVLIYEIIFAFSPEEEKNIERKRYEWMRANLDWCNKNFQKGNVLMARYDQDESTGHAHIFLVPLYEGKLCAKHYTGDKRKLSALQTSYAKAMERFGLERGNCYLEMNEKAPHHVSLKDYYRKIEQNEIGTKKEYNDIEI